MSLARLWKMIVHPSDGTREKVKAAVERSTLDRQIARSRFEDTIRELLEVNDRVTGRSTNAEDKR
jgi:hypothetical protein